MSEHYPGPPSVNGADQVEHVDDVELIDPAPAPVDTDSADIEGEAIDLDDDAVDEAADDEAPADEAAEDSGPNGTGMLVLDSWQIQIPATGDATVDAALARLTDVDGLPPAQHADVYEAVHAGLHEALADLDRA